MHLVVATDAQWILDEVVAALGGPDTSFSVVTDGREVSKTVAASTKDGGRGVDAAILDLQIGTMGGMAVAMDLRLDHSGGRLPRIPILMLLDREADVHLARRSGADGWIIKPLDSLRLRKALAAIVAGGAYCEPADSLTV